VPKSPTDPTLVFNTQLLAINDIAFFNDMLPNMPAFGAAVDCGRPGPSNPSFGACQAGYNSLTPTQAFYAYTLNNFGAKRGREPGTERARKNFGIVSKMQARNVDPAAEICRKVSRR
jgi:hypothetical protein